MAVEPPSFEGSERFSSETATLFDVITECRVVSGCEPWWGEWV